MKSHRIYLKKLYAFLLLALFSTSVLPLKLLHRHEGEHTLISRDFSRAEHITSGHQVFCPVCSCIFTQHYRPAAAPETFLRSLPAFHVIAPQGFYAPETFLFRPLRGPPAC